MKNPFLLQKPVLPSAEFQRTVLIGDLFEMVGRQRTVWAVRKLINVRNLPAQAEMAQVDGLGRVTVNIDDLEIGVLFKRISEAVS